MNPTDLETACAKLPAQALKRIDRQAKRDKLTRSTWIRRLILRELGLVDDLRNRGGRRPGP